MAPDSRVARIGGVFPRRGQLSARLQPWPRAWMVIPSRARASKTPRRPACHVPIHRVRTRGGPDRPGGRPPGRRAGRLARGEGAQDAAPRRDRGRRSRPLLRGPRIRTRPPAPRLLPRAAPRRAAPALRASDGGAPTPTSRPANRGLGEHSRPGRRTSADLDPGYSGSFKSRQANDLPSLANPGAGLERDVAGRCRGPSRVGRRLPV
jgi:hypothetical protein